MGAVIVGCDVGGTFTDLILHDPSNGGLQLAKVPTTTANQAHGVIAALEKTGMSAHGVDLFIHGTTATTNAVLERKLAKCGLITTRGFRDVLELGRRTRPNPYGLIGTFEPIIPRDLRFEVTERMDASGSVVDPPFRGRGPRSREEAACAGCRVGRHPFPAFLRQSQSRIACRRDREIALAQRVRYGRPPNHRGMPRVRARRDRRRQRFGPADPPSLFEQARS